MKATDYNVLKFDAAKNKLLNITQGYGFDSFDDAVYFADEESAKSGLSTAVRADYYDISDEDSFPVLEGQEIVYVNLAGDDTADVFSDTDKPEEIAPKEVTHEDPSELDFSEPEIDYDALVEELEENEDQVECKVCYGLFPKVDCKKLAVGYICPICGQAEHAHQGTNLDLVDADPSDIQYDDPRITKLELEEPKILEVTDGTDIRAHEAGLKPIAEESDTNEVLDEHVNEEHPPIESTVELQGIDNAVVDCQGPNKVVSHSEDEKPLDCLMKEPPLEEPLTEAYFKEAIEKEVDLDKKLKLYNDYIAFLNDKKEKLEKCLLKADNELIVDDIKKDLAAAEATLEKDLPEAIKDPDTEVAEEPAEVEENETVEVSDSDKEEK